MSSEAFDGRRRAPWQREVGIASVLERWEDGRRGKNMVLAHELPPREARTGPVPDSLAGPVREALQKRGITSLYTHQLEALAHAAAGHDFVVATPTASGKSLCYHLPVMDGLARDSTARALYLFPTKALARDQEDGLRGLLRDAGIGQGAITYDGDTPGDARRAARERAGVLITNPDMLHASILPHHANWARFFANLRFVVVDELHMYRGVFGSHLANVVRRLQRIARFHGSEPLFIAASATIGNPAEHASRIVGRPVRVLGESGAPSGPRHVRVYNPPVINAELGIRESYIKAAVRLTVDLVSADVATLVFGQSRNGVEVMLKYLRDKMPNVPPESIQAYRGGYLPDTRRRIELGLREGNIRCVVSTNALELGIDIGALDAVVCAGYPGTIAGLWQRFGRAGRRQEPSIAVLVTSSQPHDQFVARDPEQIVGAPVEEARIDPNNVEILIQHLKCAAFELPFSESDPFGDVPRDALADALGFLAEHEVVHPARDGRGELVYHWAAGSYPANNVSLRSVGWDNFVIIDLDTDKTIAEMDWRSTHTMLHVQAIYQHDGGQFQVERLDFDNHKAFVRGVAPDYYTTAQTHTRVSVLEQDDQASVRLTPDVSLAAGLGDVSVIERVVGYKKIKFHTHENVGYGDVRLPEMQMHTTGFWLTFPEDWVQARPEPRAAVIDALRGLSKAMHTVASIGLMVDPRDLGRTLGDKTDADGPPSKGVGGGPGFDPTIFLYDYVAGGIGLAPRLFDEREVLLQRTRRLVEACECQAGCPACIGPDAGESDEQGEPIAGVMPTRKEIVLDVLRSVGVLSLH
ncbi:MAG: DEAD/DEAH box helicase [Sandaracinaceae bacterium]|nr:DEAD/DEAH box helicase [Sandaracinaceae bacterium]